MSNSRFFAAVVVCAGFVAGASEAAGEVVYSNLVNSRNHVVASAKFWDDATIVGGGRLTEFGMLAYNAQSGPARVLTTNVSIYLFDEAGGLPNGELLLSFVVMSAATPAGTSLLATADLTAFDITVPDNARLGVLFDFEPNSGAILCDPPTIGSSTSTLWTGDTPVIWPTQGSGDSNLGFQISADTNPAPAPGAIALMMVGAGAAMRRKRNS